MTESIFNDVFADEEIRKEFFRVKSKVKSYQNDEEVIADLNKHFKTVLLEQYPEAISAMCLDKALEKEFKNKGTIKISEKSRKRIIDHMLKELRSNYGEWINVYNFDKKFRGYSNFKVVYKTDLGRLYGSLHGTYLDHLFYTSHCFERFRDRYNKDLFKNMNLAFKQVKFTTPNPADYLRFLVMNSFKFCETDQFIYIDVMCGILVVEKLSENLFIAKTFLTYNMFYPKYNWKFSIIPAMMLSGLMRQQMWEKFPLEHIGDHIVSAPEEFSYPTCMGYLSYQKFNSMMEC
jgi:hypothetical protein